MNLRNARAVVIVFNFVMVSLVVLGGTDALFRMCVLTFIARAVDTCQIPLFKSV